MAQPAESVQPLAPGRGGRKHRERGAPASLDGAPGEHKIAGVDILRDGRIAGAQILWGEEQAARGGRAEPRTGAEAAHGSLQVAPDLPERQPVKLPAIRPSPHANPHDPPDPGIREPNL